MFCLHVRLGPTCGQCLWKARSIGFSGTGGTGPSFGKTGSRVAEAGPGVLTLSSLFPKRSVFRHVLPNSMLVLFKTATAQNVITRNHEFILFPFLFLTWKRKSMQDNYDGVFKEITDTTEYSILKHSLSFFFSNSNWTRKYGNSSFLKKRNI